MSGELSDPRVSTTNLVVGMWGVVIWRGFPDFSWFCLLNLICWRGFHVSVRNRAYLPEAALRAPTFIITKNWKLLTKISQLLP